MGKKIIILFVLAMAMRLLALASFDSAESIMHRDGKDYFGIATNIVNHGVYSMDDSTGELKSDNFRTPLYPLFLTPFVLLDASLYTIALVQSLIMSLGIVLIFLLAKDVFEPRAAYYGSLALALEPYTALLNNQLVTEWLLALFFIPALLFTAKYCLGRKIIHYMLASCLFALSALIKPVVFPILFLIPFVAFIDGCSKQTLKHALASLIVIATISAPWIVRNKIQLGFWSYSTIVEYNVYNYNAKHFNRWLEDRRLLDNNKLDYEKLDLTHYWQAEKASTYLNAGKRFILEYPFYYAVFIGQTFSNMFTDTSYSTITEGLDLNQVTSDFILKLSTWIFSLIALFAFLDSTLAKNRLLVGKLVMILLILGLTLLSAPFGAARYRVGINQLLFIMATSYVLLTYQKLRTGICPSEDVAQS